MRDRVMSRNVMSRNRLLAANWKMNLLRQDTIEYCSRLATGLESPASEIVIFPSFPLLHLLTESVAANALGEIVAIGGQDLHPSSAGAHTGDTSAEQLVNAGCSWVLCGHSERRRDHGESDALVAEKVAAAIASGLKPMICIGETLEERESGKTHAILERQLAAAWRAAGRPAEEGAHSQPAIAYEPVWAIGTGRTATPEMAQEAHAFVRSSLRKLAGEERSASTRILYGGSVKPDNCAELIGEPDIDGFLIGGASLDPISFLDIIRRCDSARSS